MANPILLGILGGMGKAAQSWEADSDAERQRQRAEQERYRLLDYQRRQTLIDRANEEQSPAGQARLGEAQARTSLAQAQAAAEPIDAQARADKARAEVTRQENEMTRQLRLDADRAQREEDRAKEDKRRAAKDLKDAEKDAAQKRKDKHELDKKFAEAGHQQELFIQQYRSLGPMDTEEKKALYKEMLGNPLVLRSIWDQLEAQAKTAPAPEDTAGMKGYQPEPIQQPTPEEMMLAPPGLGAAPLPSNVGATGTPATQATQPTGVGAAPVDHAAQRAALKARAMSPPQSMSDAQAEQWLISSGW